MKRKRQAGDLKQATMTASLAKATRSSQEPVSVPLEIQGSVPFIQESLYQEGKKSFDLYHTRLAEHVKPVPSRPGRAGLRHSHGGGLDLVEPGKGCVDVLEAEGLLEDDPENREDGGSSREALRWENDGVKFLGQLREMMGPNWALPVTPIQIAVMRIICHHDEHKDRELSLRALRVMMGALKDHPPVEAATDGSAHLITYDSIWHPMVRLALPLGEGHEEVNGFKLLLSVVRRCLERLRDGGGGEGASLVLSYLVALFQQDLGIRLGVYGRVSGKEGERALALVTHSLLWRTLQDDPGWSGQGSKEELYQDLVEVVLLARKEEQGEGVETYKPCAVGRPLLGLLASELLLLCFEVCSACEEGGLYSEGRGRTRDAHSHNNRVQLDHALLGRLMRPEGSELNNPENKQFIINILQPRDRLRLLGMMLATYNHRRSYEQTLSEELAAAYMYHHIDRGKGSDGFYYIEPRLVAEYLVTHYDWALDTVLGGGEGLDIFVSQLALATLKAKQEGGGTDKGVLSTLRDLLTKLTDRPARHLSSEAMVGRALALYLVSGRLT